MDFSIERVNSERIKYFHSPSDSGIELVFVPGPLNAELWRHQFRYLSRKYSTTTFDVWRSSRDYSRIHRILDGLLEQEFDNTVLVGWGPGNSIVQSMEHRKNVIGTVLSGPDRTARRIPRPLYRTLGKVLKEPKLMKKIFFSDSTDYRVVRNFLKDFDMPGHDEFHSFTAHYRLRKPVKNSLAIHAEDDRFSDENGRELCPGSQSAYIKSAGSFSFYERPQDYNKALTEFLDRLEPFMEEREVKKSKEKHRSLKEFAASVVK